MLKEEARARRYQRARRYLRLADFLLGWAWLAALLLLGWSAVLCDFAWAMARNFGVALLCYTALLALLGKALGLPLDYYSGYVLEHRYGLSNQTRAAWVKDQAKGFALGVALALVATQVLYRLLRSFPEHWWLIAWAVFLLFVVALANLAPVLLFPLFYKFRPLQDKEINQRLLGLCDRAGTRVRGIFEWKLSAKSRKANAALTGWGNTRRILLADTLLENYSPEEIESILAHELAHHVHHHIGKSLALQAATGFAGFWLADVALRVFTPRFGFLGLDDFANLPLLALVGAALSLVLLPVVNSVSRYFERQADDYALRAISRVDPFISSMEKLAAQNLSERRPHPLLEFLFHSHPSVEKRIRRAQAYSQTPLVSPG